MDCFNYSHFFVKQKANHLYLQIVDLMCLDKFQYFALREMTKSNGCKLEQSIQDIRSRFIREIKEFSAFYFPDLKIYEKKIMGGWKDPGYPQQLLFIRNRLEDIIGRNTKMVQNS